jgi:glycosyltransferase involved in cell wall biosynthesis
MDDADSILLTIGIPTYNRAELLRSALLSLAPQVREFADEVELIVSNNNSDDDTEEVVEWARQYGPIRYHRNRENIGGTRNVVLIPTLAKGKFCWILGDDDFVRPLAVKKVLETIKSYPDIDYIYVNIAHFSTGRLNLLPQPVSSADLPWNLKLGNRDPKEYYVDTWETLITPKISEIFLGAIMVSVVRTSIWRKYASLLTIGEFGSNFDSVYPHIRLFAHGLVGKHAYYIGKPFIVVIDGAREWLDYVPKICLVYLHEALDIYELHGVNSRLIKRCERSLVRNNRYFLSRLLKDEEIRDLDSFSVEDYIRKYWRYLGVVFFIKNFPYLVKYYLRKKRDT